MFVCVCVFILVGVGGRLNHLVLKRGLKETATKDNPDPCAAAYKWENINTPASMRGHTGCRCWLEVLIYITQGGFVQGNNLMLLSEISKFLTAFLKAVGLRSHLEVKAEADNPSRNMLDLFNRPHIIS